MMEEFLWAGSHYLIYNDEKNSNAAYRHQTEQKGAGFIADVNQGSGEKSDLVLSYQLDGEWMLSRLARRVSEGARETNADDH